MGCEVSASQIDRMVDTIVRNDEFVGSIPTSSTKKIASQCGPWCRALRKCTELVLALTPTPSLAREHEQRAVGTDKHGENHLGIVIGGTFVSASLMPARTIKPRPGSSEATFLRCIRTNGIIGLTQHPGGYTRSGRTSQNHRCLGVHDAALCSGDGSA
jgi:hypothetical protein